MADDMWTRIKDFAFRHSPEWLQGRLDEHAPVRSVPSQEETLRERYGLRATGDDSPPIRGDGDGYGNVFSKPQSSPEILEGRYEEIMRRYGEETRRGQVQTQPVITRLKEGKPLEAGDIGFVSPQTDRGWVAHDLIQAAEHRRSGDLFTAKAYVQQARADMRVAARQQNFDISR